MSSILIEVFENLKKYVYIIDRDEKGILIIQFHNENFYHLVGLHKTNIDMFMPSYIKSKDKQYKFIKKNIEQFNSILENQIKGNHTLQYRINTFQNILDLLKGNNTLLYSLKTNNQPMSLYDGDYGLIKSYDKISCLLGLKETDNINNKIICVPQSWMASRGLNPLIKNKKTLYLKSINEIPSELFNGNNIK